MAAEIECSFPGCNQGTVFNRVTKKRETCPECGKKRAKAIHTGETETRENLSELLGFGTSLRSDIFSWDLVIPDKEKKFMDLDSIDRVGDKLTSIYNDAILGQCPTNSYCFGLGIKGNPFMVAYPIMAQAYRFGRKVSPLISATELSRIMNASEPIDEFLNADICVVLLNEGMSKGDIFATKGLMQMRSSKGRGTIFLTTWQVEACSALLGYYGEPQEGLAEPYFVSYKARSASTDKKTGYINDILGLKEGSALPSNESKTDIPSVRMRDLTSL